MPPLFRLSILAAACLLFACPASACEPCLTRSSLEQTVRQADVIALLQNDDRNSGGTLDARPELLELSVVQLYKGNIDTSSLLVRSWYGECAYGVQMRMNTKSIVFLQEVRDIATGQFDGTYKLVEDGCSEGQLPVSGNTVRLNDHWIPLDGFVSANLK